MRVINDPLGQIHNLASSEHCFRFVLFWSLLAVTVGRPSGSIITNVLGKIFYFWLHRNIVFPKVPNFSRNFSTNDKIFHHNYFLFLLELTFVLWYFESADGRMYQWTYGQTTHAKIVITTSRDYGSAWWIKKHGRNSFSNRSLTKKMCNITHS